MAMNPMQKKARTSFLLGMFLTLVITGLIIAFLIMQLGKIKKEQDAIQYKQVYVVSQATASGERLEGATTVKRVESTAVPSNAITSANAATYLTELATAKIELEIGTVLTTDMINAEGQADTADVRMQEYNMIILPSKLEVGQTIDIRLRLPSGEDYIVLSKKYIEDTNANTIWIKVGEDEILTMSNAVVEAYIMQGALLYATIYTDAGNQGATTPTYVVSNNVINLMNSDPNIVPTAKAALAARYTDAARAQRDVINQAKNSYNEQAKSNVESKIQEEIQKTQAARQTYIDSLGI
ncbi:MAG: hypothetical protein HFJ54_02510 [Clostridia bacterium]|nr:hypothetical protein [Clostridia bacterium]